MNRRRFVKIAGKLVTYLGFIVTISGIVNTNPFYAIIGIVWVIIGCLMHEVSEE